MNILLLMVLIPFVMSIPAFFLAKKSLKAGYAVLILTAAAAFAGAVWLFLGALQSRFASDSLSGICFFGLTFRGDGFRSLYALILSFMWLMTSLFSPQYFAHSHKHGRYLFFTLVTLGATLGVFLSDDIITAFIFFEIMSFSSYPWVAHEETPGAMRAAATYLAIAILGGMAMLMGLMMLSPVLGTFQFDNLVAAAQALEDKSVLYLPCTLILAGFGAKAGMFPLHVWLPKAHPVAPAPASALLSGALTKVGIFGILIVSTRILLHDTAWGNLLLILGLITMFAGALLALLSVDLKRTLACSSMSQIGFILAGVAMQNLLGEHNALAAQGTVLHMLNHSLIKLCLFMCAGVVYLGLHKLNLNDIRGYGRNKPFLHLCFLIGAASISGVPMFSGYISKTLLHESMIEYVVHLDHLGQSSFWYAAGEWVFVITGGMTFAYMLKLYIAIFWQKPNADHQAHQEGKRYLAPLSYLALLGSAAVLLALGIFPNQSMTPLANLSLPFVQAHPPEHAVDYFSLVNLLGTGKSLLIGLVLYLLVVRRYLARKQEGSLVYLDRKPQWLDLEDTVYRPGLKALLTVGSGFAALFHRLPDFTGKAGIRAVRGVSGFLASVPDKLISGGLWLGKAAAMILSATMDSVMALLGNTLFLPPKGRKPVPVGNRFTYTLGQVFNFFSGMKNRLLRRAQPVVRKYTYIFAALWQEAVTAFDRMTHSLSFSLMMFSIGLLVTLMYLMTR